MDTPSPSTELILADSRLIESLGGVVWEGDPDTFRLLHVSAAREHILGYPRAQWLDDPYFWRTQTHPDDVEKCAAVWRDAAREPHVHEIEHRMIAADRRIVRVRTTVRAVPAEQGRARLRGFSVDVTSRAEQMERVRQAETLEAIGRLTGGIAHDFNNLLTVITGYAETLLMAMESADPNLADVVEIRRAADRAARLTQQLLAFGRKQLLRPERVDVGELVRAVSSSIERLLGDSIELTMDFAPGAAVTLVDRTQLECVLRTLASNSRDAMPYGGRFELRTSIETVSDERAALLYPIPPGSYVLLSATDTGTGMTPETRAHIFEPFFTTKKRGGSSGISLASTYGIVMQSGGGIFVDSEVGSGTRFDIYLPRSEKPAVRSATVSGGTILLVEDYGKVRDLAKKVLVRHGYEVLTAGSGDDALAICTAYEGTIDVLVTDVNMDGMTGPELAKRIVAIRSDIAVLYMSGYAGDVLDGHDLSGGTSFIGKPFTPADLAQKVRELVVKTPTR